MERRNTDIWFTEYQTKHLRLGLSIKSVLANIQTPYQHLLVVDTDQYGRLMALDGAIQLTESDEFTYHEMLAHVALTSHPAPRRILIVGGGDGGTAREAVKHETVEEVVLVDIDQEVINASKQFFPSLSSGLEDPKVNVLVMDALEYIRGKSGKFDVVIVDSTDPVDFAEGLFREPFYRDVFRALNEGGSLVAQTESPFSDPDILTGAVSEMEKVFPIVKVFWGAMPTYPTGMWTYTIGSKVHEPGEPRGQIPPETRYYSEEIHRAAFVLPPFLEEILQGRDR
ncbi:MAG: polyamine aminopropyltransferase [Thermovirgaceae bacterium]|jgi:spermidine synthase|nr:polyamine aminopropyltransferase [Synergistales bacterium]MDI9391964.1 polyamine aminopropyltransferase [Synergistota bacterium]NLV65786.1 polyamine aminopropyltransferase [Synergistaceae bacterium]HRW87469.1 polyamine aminopropyltransferase [Thermovirgaceae bacterium]MDD3133439.1 polyamine aminopropyltransferase [Synergistales bacterium]